MTHKNTVLYLTLALSLNLTVSCSTSTATTDTERVDIPTVTFEPFANDHTLSDSFSKVKFIQLEMTDDCIIGRIKKIEDADGTLVILTRNEEIFAFNKENGKFLHQIGRVGEGPGEYLEATDMYYNEKTKSINIYDHLKGAVLSYSINGEFFMKQNIETSIHWANCFAGTTDGFLIFSNLLSDGDKASDYAYTLINPDGIYSSFDQFAPVYVKGYITDYAERPMTSIGEQISFFKFLNDTIFTMEKGKVTPIYKLSMKKRMPRKDIVAQMGPFAVSELLKMSSSGGYFSGFGEIFETERYIALIPTYHTVEGYFWIDKETGTGYHIPSSNEVRIDVYQVIQGRSIAYLVGANEKELISAYPANFRNNLFVRQIAEHPKLNLISPDLKPFWESVDPDGNPCLIIYEH